MGDPRWRCEEQRRLALFLISLDRPMPKCHQVIGQISVISAPNGEMHDNPGTNEVLLRANRRLAAFPWVPVSGIHGVSG